MIHSSDTLGRLSALDSSALSDALDALGLPSGVSGLHPVTVQEKMFGFARTAIMESLTGGKSGAHILTAVVAAAGPEDVIVIDNAARTDVSCWGGILGLGAVEQGVRGVLVDGVCRDVDENRELGLPVYSRGGSPVTARGRLQQRSAGEPATIAGRTVHEGDLILHDATGLVVIPQDRIDEVLDHAEAIVAREKAIADEVRGGRPLPEAMRDARLAGQEEK